MKKNKKDIFGFGKAINTNVINELSKKNLDKVLKILRGVKDLNIVGFDLVEVAPPYDHADVTSLAGASIVLEFLYILGYQKRH